MDSGFDGEVPPRDRWGGGGSTSDDPLIAGSVDGGGILTTSGFAVDKFAVAGLVVASCKNFGVIRLLPSVVLVSICLSVRLLGGCNGDCDVGCDGS